MGEEVKMSDHYETNGGNDDNAGDDERIVEWEVGLPSADDLTPLSQPLIPPELASAFSISLEPCRTLLDLNRASQSTFSSLRGGGGGGLNVLSSNNFKWLNEDGNMATDAMVVEAVEEENNGGVGTDREGLGSESRKLRKVMESEEGDSALRADNSAEDPSSAAARTLKRPRLVWTPQLHKRFVDVVSHLGIKNAVPKTIMQLMNVEGLTRENVASHLQKYRLYLKRMQGLSNEGPSSSDQLFASTPVPQSLHESSGGGGGSSGASANGGGGWSGAAHGNGHLSMPIPVPYHPGAGAMMPMPVYGHMGMQMGNHHHPHPHPHPPPPPPPPHHHHPNGFDGSGPYNILQQRDWNGHNYGYHHPHHVAPNDNM